jgi:hypothetical protein
MMRRDDDEELERRRQQKEREAMSLVDRAHGTPKRIASDGMPDGRSERRTGRVAQVHFRTTLPVKAVLRAIKKRDKIPSDPLLLELLIEVYLARFDTPPLEIVSEEELVLGLERKRDEDDAEKLDGR